MLRSLLQAGRYTVCYTFGFTLGVLEGTADASEGVEINQAGVDRIGHDFIQALAESFDGLQRASGFDRPQDLDHALDPNLVYGDLTELGQHMQGHVFFNVVGVSFGDLAAFCY